MTHSEGASDPSTRSPRPGTGAATARAPCPRAPGSFESGRRGRPEKGGEVGKGARAGVQRTGKG